MLDRADAALERDANDERHLVDAVRALVELRHLADDLVEGRVHEAIELDLAHRAIAANGKAHRSAHNGRLGKGRVDDAVFAEVLLQSVGDAKHAAELADVLAHDEDLLVLLHRATQALVQGLRHGHGGRRHQLPPPLTPSSIISRRPSSISGCGSAYAWSNMVIGSGRSMASTSSRSCSASASASRATSSNLSFFTWYSRASNAFTRSMGSRCFQTSTSASMR